MASYSDKLKDPRWQKKRLEILKRDEFTCQSCGSDDQTLHVHHKIYAKNRDPWNYDNKYLITYCDFCHGEVETKIYQIKEKLSNLSLSEEYYDILDVITYFVDNFNFYDWGNIIESIDNLINKNKNG